MNDVAESKVRFDPIGWQLLTVLGLSLLVGGGIDLALGLYPLGFGVPEWEFAAIANLLNRLPIVGLGLSFLLTAALGTHRRALTYTWSIGLLSVAVIVLGFGVFYATNLPLVLGGVHAGPAGTGIYKAIAKTAVQIPTFFLGFFVVAIVGFRAPARFGRPA